MEITIIIPVYNSSLFIAKAIDSALIQEECREIILIEDNSTDSSLDICQKYASQNERVKLYINEENKGPSYCRNLGIKEANHTYISFLDADDYYLENRFKSTELLFQNHENATGVYEAIGVYYYSDEIRAKHLQRIGSDITMLREKVRPENLLETLLKGKSGHFSIVGLTLKKAALKDTDLFDETLRMGEDTDFIWNLAFLYHLIGGTVDNIVAIRGVHKNNSVFMNPDILEYEKLLHKKWLSKISEKKSSKKITRLILRNAINKYLIEKNKEQSHFLLKKLWIMAKILAKHPQLIPKIFFE